MSECSREINFNATYFDHNLDRLERYVFVSGVQKKKKKRDTALVSLRRLVAEGWEKILTESGQSKSPEINFEFFRLATRWRNAHGQLQKRISIKNSPN